MATSNTTQSSTVHPKTTMAFFGFAVGAVAGFYIKNGRQKGAIIGGVIGAILMYSAVKYLQKDNSVIANK